MPKSYCNSWAKTQRGAQDSIASNTYYRGDNDIAFVVGQFVYARVPTDLPRGAIINTANLLLNFYSNKNAAGSVSFTIYGHASGDSEMLNIGANEAGRQLTSNNINWVVTYSDGWNETQTSPSLVAIIQELVNRPDWQPGGYITIMLYCYAETGDMRARLNNDFIQAPELQIDWSEPNTNLKRQINLCENPNFDITRDQAHPGGTDSTLGYWYQNPFFGAYVDPANQGTIAKETSFTRVAGRNCMKFTTGTPSGDSKATGPFTQIVVDGPDSFVFAGWIYIPSNITETVVAEMPFAGGQTNYVITARDQWVPFCTRPYAFGETGVKVRYVSVYIAGPWGGGKSFYLSEPTILNTNFQQMPWSGMQDDNLIVDYYGGWSGQRQHGNRQWTPRRWTSEGGGGVVRARSTWTKHASGLLTLSEPTKGSIPASALTGTADTLTGTAGEL